VGHNDYVFVARTGFFVRTTSAVPYARTQSVRLLQGPWSKRLGVASVHVDVVPGRVSIRGHYRDAAEARELVDRQAVRARTARADASGVRWAAPPDPDASSVPTGALVQPPTPADAFTEPDLRNAAVTSQAGTEATGAPATDSARD
jgi:hypothetical protein